MKTNLVVGLLVVIVLLLCTPLKQRAALVRSLILCAGLIAVADFIIPPIVGLLAPPIQYYWGRFGWLGMFLLIGVPGCAAVFYAAWKSDQAENKAIRAGSVEAFNKRVEAYKRDPFHYDHDKAVEATLRIKDGK